jgi:thiol-disulfide isomerase/thioredoxin
VNESRRLALIVAAAALGLATGVYFGFIRNPVPEGPSKAAVEAFYAMTLPDLENRPQRMRQWKDRVLVVNFWATWCAPCREEIPGLMRYQAGSSSKSVQIVGIALDAPEKVAEFAKSVGINYAVVIGGFDAIKLAETLGNKSGALPYTVLIAPDGKQSRSHLGVVSEAMLDRLIAEMDGSAKL